MDKRKFLVWIIALFLGLQLTSCVSGEQTSRGKGDDYWRHEDPALQNDMFRGK